MSKSFAVCPLTKVRMVATHGVPPYCIDPLTNKPTKRALISRESRSYIRIYGAKAISYVEYREYLNATKVKTTKVSLGNPQRETLFTKPQTTDLRSNSFTYEEVAAKFIISESSPSGVASSTTGKPVGAKARYWRLYMGRGSCDVITNPDTGEVMKERTGSTVAAHRVVFMLKHKRAVKPGYVIDHINGDCFDNSPENLREVSQQLNALNRKGAMKAREAGYVGVGYVKRRKCYVGRCKIGGVIHYTKSYQDIHACHRALEKIRESLGILTLSE